MEGVYTMIPFLLEYTTGKNILEAVLSLSFLHDHGLDSRKCLTVFCTSYGAVVNSTAELSILRGVHSSHQ